MEWDYIKKEYIDCWGCKEIREYYEVAATVSDKKKSMTSTLQVYPIPARYLLHVHANMAGSNIATLDITDMSGRMVKTQSISTGHSADVMIDVSALPAGSYILHIDAGAEVMTKKVIVD